MTIFLFWGSNNATAATLNGFYVTDEASLPSIFNAIRNNPNYDYNDDHIVCFSKETLSPEERQRMGYSYTYYMNRFVHIEPKNHAEIIDYLQSRQKAT